MIWEAKPTGKRGRQPVYSDPAIQTCLTMKVLFGMALRQTTGFVESLLRLIDLDWTVPNFSTLSRRQKTLKVNIPYRGSQGPLHLLIDSTGIKVEGEGEWNARKHGGTKRRVWRKIHIGIDEQTLEIRAARLQSSRPARTPSPGSPTAPGRLHATKPCAHHGASAGRSGDDGAGITAGAASKQRCTVSNCWVSASWRGTSTVRWPSSRSALPS